MKKFINKRKLEEISFELENILYSKTRIEDCENLDVVGGINPSVELQSLLGAKFKVPLVDKNSPIALPLVIYLHKKYNHKGIESTYRLSLEKVKIIDGKPLFKLVGNKCVICRMKRKRLLKQIMGPLSKYQVSISPLFYYCMVDMWGPLSIYAQGFERNTRSAAAKKYKAYFLIFVCAVTGMCNVQLIEGRDTPSVLDGCSRFFDETTVPKVMLPDADGALLKAFTRGEIALTDIAGNLYKVKGIHFEVCPPQGHSAHGKVERKIRTLQEALSSSNLKGSRCTATGYMTIAKAIENEVNNVPIGYLYDDSNGVEGNPVLKVLRPNSLKGFGLTDRAPRGLFTIPDTPKDLMTKISDLFNSWYTCWATSYLPLLLERQKWNDESEDLNPNDIIYFKLLDSPLGATWRLGKVDQVKIGKDGHVREIVVAYKVIEEDDVTNWRHSTVVRPVRECIKLLDIEDTTFAEDMEKIRLRAAELLHLNEEKSESNEDVDLFSYISTKVEMDPALLKFVSCCSVSQWNSGFTGSSAGNERWSAERDSYDKDINKFDEMLFLL